MDIATLGIRIDSAGATKGADDLGKLTAAAGRAEAATDKLAGSSAQVGKGVGDLAMKSRGAAQQLSQVAQQTMATGNFMQALAIQLPDIGMMFGTIGIAAGVLAGVALPLLASAFGDTRKEADALESAMDAMSKAVTAFSTASAAARAPIDELALTYGRLATEASLALTALSDVTQVEAMNAVTTSIELMLESLGSFNGRGGYQLADDFGLAREQVVGLLGALRELDNANGLEAQASAAQAVNDALLSAYGSVAAMPAPLQSAYRSMAQIALSAAEAGTNAGDAAAAVTRIFNAAEAAAGAMGRIGGAAMSSIGGVQALAQAAWDLAGAMGEAERMRVASGNEYGKLVNEYGGGADAARAKSMQKYTSPAPRISSGAGGVRAPSGGGGGGGGGGGADDFAARIESMREELRTERQVVDEWYAEGQKLLADRRALEILGEQGHVEAKLALEEEYQSRLAGIKEAGNRFSLESAAGGAATILNALGAFNKKALKLATVASAAQALISTYEGAAKELRNGTFGFASAAAVIAKGLGFVAAIKSVGSGGSGGGGGSGGSGGRVAASQGGTAAVAQQPSLIVQGVRADDIFTGQMLFDMFGKEAALRGMQGIWFI